MQAHEQTDGQANGIDTQYLWDRTMIQDLVTRYFAAIDRADAALVRTCFTDDVEAIYAGGPKLKGIEVLMSSLQPFFNRVESGQTKVTTHFMGNFSLERLEGDLAETETYALTFHVRPNDTEDQVGIRSLRYFDRLRKTGKHWHIYQRQHTLDWSSEHSAKDAVTKATRLLRLPPGNL